MIVHTEHYMVEKGELTILKMVTDFDYSGGMKEDFNNMTSEIGRSITVQTRDDVLSYEGFEGESSGYNTGVTETVFIQELDTEHEMVSSGELKVGDVRLVFKDDTIAEEEGRVVDGTINYKIIDFTKVKGEDGAVIYFKAHGKKLANR